MLVNIVYIYISQHCNSKTELRLELWMMLT